MNYTVFLDHFIVNSIFTKKQISIIYKKMLKAKPNENMTSGAYYRQLGQCRTKIRKAVYTLLLLRLLTVIDIVLTVIDIETLSILDQLNNQINVILNKESDEIDAVSLDNVMLLIDNVIKKLVLI
ncbi:MAG: hypothetical protein E6L01_04715 [Thaumarchaeota archaeon]|nr:MAG: hypothetical protein E6L01_04715 [Nitrososphaerota archaeon]